MEITKKIRHILSNIDERDLYKYMIGAIAVVLISFLGLIYLHRRRISYYTNEIENINVGRKKAKRLLTEYKLVDQQRAKIDKILQSEPNFFIVKKYQDIINQLGLTNNSEEPKRSSGETVSDKTETILNVTLNNITMRQLTELLSALADVVQIYPKELTIKKAASSQLISADLVIATLEATHST